MHLKLLWLLAVMTLISYCEAQCGHLLANTVPKADADYIVKKHNEVRLRIANGQVKGQPRGINLKRFKYDSALAKAAQDIANSCVFQHKAVHDSRFSVGQNLFMTSSSAPSQGTDWNSTVESWFSEHVSYHYQKCCEGYEKTGHYTQVVWANTEYVGCGFSYFQNSDKNFPYHKIYVCNYGPAGNVGGQLPYKTGSSGCNNLC